MELWKDIPGYPGYKVSDQGRVRGKSGKILKPRPNSPSRPGNLPYENVALYGPQGRKDRQIHHLVLEAFVGPRPEGCEACHNNSNVGDNRLSNLRWDTRQGNDADRVANKTECLNGHPYLPKNIMMVNNGKRTVRKCRTCHNAKSLARYHASR